MSRYQKEEASVDHAWAGLLAAGQVKQTPFTRVRIERFQANGVEMTVVFFAARRQGKVALVLELRNASRTTPWRLGASGLAAEDTPSALKSFALRMSSPEILPGDSARLAVVVDRSEFTTAEGLVNLTLDVSEKEGPLQLTVLLDRRLFAEEK